MFMMAGLANGSGCCLRIIGDLVTQPNLVHRNRIGLLFPSQSIHTEKVSEQAGGGRQSPASRAHATLTPAISGHRTAPQTLPYPESTPSDRDPTLRGGRIPNPSAQRAGWSALRAVGVGGGPLRSGRAHLSRSGPDRTLASPA